MLFREWKHLLVFSGNLGDSAKTRRDSYAFALNMPFVPIHLLESLSPFPIFEVCLWTRWKQMSEQFSRGTLDKLYGDSLWEVKVPLKARFQRRTIDYRHTSVVVIGNRLLWNYMESHKHPKSWTTKMFSCVEGFFWILTDTLEQC